MGRVWSCSGLRWSGDGPVLVWGGGRGSALAWGQRVAFGVAEGGRRTCVGARGHVCPLGAAVAGRSSGARCEECARLERAHSVAADTIADDPRPYHVYLAWFGPGMVKVGITGVERGSARLLEQGAITFSWLGRGPLMAARRAEELLRAALRVPDRIPYAEKRAVRAALPGVGGAGGLGVGGAGGVGVGRARELEVGGPEELGGGGVRESGVGGVGDAGVGARVVEIAELHARAGLLDGWPESLERAPFQAVDHTEVFGLAGLAPADGVVSELIAGGVVSGELLAAAGPDLHLATGLGVVVLDTRLLPGWELTAVTAADGDGRVTVPVRESRSGAGSAGGVQDGLF
ncbi:DUF2797 domain-containing protein [Streptomyces sp. NPDC058371]|uniref:DUF2797 domain-containing protein n=1 Tax=Streptomyces sp. NPDC058371 TaxID=3346463 RepID=UPI00364A4DA0